MKKLIWIPLVLAPMVGCTPYATDFRCPIGQGMSCRSMSEVHEALEATGEIPDPLSQNRGQFYYPPQGGVKSSSPERLLP